MAKSMARIDNGIVVNVEWFDDSHPQSETLIDIGELPVGIGCTYQDGIFYRDGEKVLSDLEEMAAELEDMRNALNILEVTADGQMDESS